MDGLNTGLLAIVLNIDLEADIICSTKWGKMLRRGHRRARLKNEENKKKEKMPSFSCKGKHNAPSELKST